MLNPKYHLARTTPIPHQFRTNSALTPIHHTRANPRKPSPFPHSRVEEEALWLVRLDAAEIGMSRIEQVIELLRNYGGWNCEDGGLLRLGPTGSDFGKLLRRWILTPAGWKPVNRKSLDPNCVWYVSRDRHEVAWHVVGTDVNKELLCREGQGRGCIDQGRALSIPAPSAKPRTFAVERRVLQLAEPPNPQL